MKRALGFTHVGLGAANLAVGVYAASHGVWQVVPINVTLGFLGLFCAAVSFGMSSR